MTYHGFVNGVRGFIRKDTTGQTRHHLGDAHLVGSLEYIVVDFDVVPLQKAIGSDFVERQHIISVDSAAASPHQEVQVLPHVQVESSYFCGQVDDVSGPILLEHSPGLLHISVHCFLNNAGGYIWIWVGKAAYLGLEF